MSALGSRHLASVLCTVSVLHSTAQPVQAAVTVQPSESEHESHRENGILNKQLETSRCCFRKEIVNVSFRAV